MSDSGQDQKRNHLKPDSVADSISLFVNQMKGLHKAFRPAFGAMTELLKVEMRAFDKFSKTSGIKKKPGAPKTFVISADKLQSYRIQSDRFLSAALAVRNIPISQFIYLVCQFDAYIGNLLRNLFVLKPEILNSSQRELTFADLLAFKSMEEARNALIETEIENVIRESHASHFDWLEKRFGVALRKDLDCWPTFIEVTERRNLFVHCDGVVSGQYLSVCKKHGFPVEPDLKKGDQLSVDAKYFDSAFKCLFEIGVKLGHVLWRKVAPGSLSNADAHLNDICFSLLSEERYGLAHQLLDFASKTLPRHDCDESRRVFVINHGIAHKFLNESDKLEELLCAEDWTACKPVFGLAVAVLRDQYDQAAALMKQIGKDGNLTKEVYATWPLFKAFREQDEFKRAYRSVFGKDFKLEEQTPKELMRTTNEEHCTTKLTKKIPAAQNRRISAQGRKKTTSS